MERSLSIGQPTATRATSVLVLSVCPNPGRARWSQYSRFDGGPQEALGVRNPADSPKCRRRRTPVSRLGVPSDILRQHAQACLRPARTNREAHVSALNDENEAWWNLDGQTGQDSPDETLVCRFLNYLP